MQARYRLEELAFDWGTVDAPQEATRLRVGDRVDVDPPWQHGSSAPVLVAAPDGEGGLRVAVVPAYLTHAGGVIDVGGQTAELQVWRLRLGTLPWASPGVPFVSATEAMDQALLTDCVIDWGDGSTETVVPYDSSTFVTSPAQLLPHVYAAPGVYEVRVTMNLADPTLILPGGMPVAARSVDIA